MNKLFVIVGPTGIGKTTLSIEIAQQLNTVIISADSRQIYRELTIGTAVPDASQLSEVQHYFIQNKSIFNNFNASMFEQEVIELLNKLFEKNRNVVLVGGSMLYIDAVCKGIDDLPTIEPTIRNKWLNAYYEKGIEFLQSELKKIDPKYYAIVDSKNPKRLRKALEVFDMSGKLYSTLRTGKVKTRNFDIVKIGLDTDRTILYNRIEKRVDTMIVNGLIDEAKSLYDNRNLNALNTVGYKELFDYFDGNITLDKAIELIKRNSRRYAKRQLSWFRHDAEIRWFRPEQKEDILRFIRE